MTSRKQLSSSFPIFVLLLLSFPKNSFQSFLSSAIASLIPQLNHHTLNLAIVGNSTEKIENIADGILKENKAQMLVSIIIAKEIYELENSAIILVSNMKELSKFNANVKLTNKVWKDFKFLVYCENASREELKKIIGNESISDQTGYRIGLFEYFLIEDKNEIELMTFEFFNKISCNKPNLVTLDSFSKEKYFWTKNYSLANYKKFKNFNGCLLNFHVVLNHLFYFRDAMLMKKFRKISLNEIFNELPKAVQKTNEFEGLHYELTQMISMEANFTPHYQFKIYDYVPKNNKVITFGFSLAHKVVSGQTADDFLYTTPYNSLEYFYVISPSESYTNYEKMFFTFDRTTWIFIGIIFGSTFVTIFIINRLPRKIQDVFYGKGVKIPFYNTLGVFFGISQTKLPQGNFSRILLTLFTLFCFMIRLYYQGMLFDLITMDLKKPSPETMEDLYDRNYKVIVLDIYQDEHKNILSGRER